MRISIKWILKIFFNKYNQGKFSDDAIFIEWANDYRHYIALHQELQERLNNVAA